MGFITLANLLYMSCRLPDYDQEISVFDYYVDESGEWDSWQSKYVYVYISSAAAGVVVCVSHEVAGLL